MHTTRKVNTPIKMMNQLICSYLSRAVLPRLPPLVLNQEIGLDRKTFKKPITPTDVKPLRKCSVQVGLSSRSSN